MVLCFHIQLIFFKNGTRTCRVPCTTTFTNKSMRMSSSRYNWLATSGISHLVRRLLGALIPLLQNSRLENSDKNIHLLLPFYMPGTRPAVTDRWKIDKDSPRDSCLLLVDVSG